MPDHKDGPSPRSSAKLGPLARLLGTLADLAEDLADGKKRITVRTSHYGAGSGANARIFVEQNDA